MIIHWRGEAIFSDSRKDSSVGSRPVRRWLLLTCLLLVMPVLQAAESVRIAVLYPTASEQVGQIYEQIIRGMAREGVVLLRRSLDEDTEAAEIQHWLKSEGSQAVVLLGKRGLRFSAGLRVDIPVITGAHVGIRADRSAVTLAADPAQLLQTLKALQPGVRRVCVIYNPQNSGWLIELARAAADKLGVTLKAVPSASARESGLALRQILQQAKPGQDAVWLLLDPVFPVKLLLPELLKVAWERDLLIFSGNPYHVQQGVLFALYPDYSVLGRQLVGLALRQVEAGGPVTHEPSRYLKRAINLRTAAHLGISAERAARQGFDLSFPMVQP